MYYMTLCHQFILHLISNYYFLLLKRTLKWQSNKEFFMLPQVKNYPNNIGYALTPFVQANNHEAKLS